MPCLAFTSLTRRPGRLIGMVWLLCAFVPVLAVAADINLSLISARAVPTASDSIDQKYNHLAGAFADGKGDTAWITGRDMRDHWARIQWRHAVVAVTRVEIDATPMTISHALRRDFLDRAPTKAVNLTTVEPERLELRVLADGTWRVLQAADANAAWTADHRLVITPAEALAGVTELRLGFRTSGPDQLVAIRELRVFGPKTVTGYSIRPKWQGLWIWGEPEPTLPNFGPIQRFFRCVFEVKDPAKVRSVKLMFSAHDRGRVFLNGTEVARTVDPGRGLRREMVRETIRPDLLRPGQNLLAIEGEDVEESDLRGVLAELWLERADGTQQSIVTHPTRFLASSVEESGWNTLSEGFAHWAKPMVTGSPNQELPWARDEDYTPAYFSDSAQITAISLVPPIPRPGEAFSLSVRVKAAKALSRAYGLLVQFGDSGAARNTGMEFNVGDAFIGPEQGLPVGWQGEKEVVVRGRWPAGTAPRQGLVLRLCNPKAQVELLPGPVGTVSGGGHPGRLRVAVGAAAPPALPAGFGDNRILPDGRLQVDGGVVAPILYTTSLQTPDRYQDWLTSGVRLFRIVPQGAGSVVPAKGAEDAHYRALLSVIETQVTTVRAMNPNARFILMLDLDMPNDWRATHHEELIVLGNNQRLVPLSAANHSLGYLRETPNAPGVMHAVTSSLTEFVGRLKQQPYAGSVIGIVMASGRAGENYWGLDINMRKDAAGKWLVADRLNYVIGDFGLAARRSLRDWLTDRYGTPEALSKAWQIPGMTFADVVSYGKWPNRRFTKDLMWHRRPEGRFMFRDRVAEGRLFEDFVRHQSEARADHLLAAAAAVKQASGGRLLTGAYVGYVIPTLTNSPPGSGQHSGHMAIGKVLASPHMDFTVSPHFYHQRRAGDAVVPMGATDSPRLHGKLWLNEFDSRTYLSPIGPKTFSQAETVQVLRKEFVAAITGDQGWWWLEFVSAPRGPKAASWFADPVLLRDASTMRELYERSLTFPRTNGPNAEVAIVFSAEQMYNTDAYSPANSVHSALVNYLYMRMFRLGAPFDLYLQTDLPELVAKGWHRQYRLVVFMNSFCLSPAERELIRRDLLADGRTALFLFAPGYQGNTGASSELALAGIEAVTGMTGVGRLDEKHLLGADIEGTAFDVLPWWGAHQIANYGQEIGPTFYLDPARSNGWTSWAGLRLDGKHQAGKVAVAMRESARARVIYSVLPDLPQDLLDRVIEVSGVHRYTRKGVLCWANRSMLGVHAVVDERGLILTAKEPVTWIEPFERRIYGRKTKSITIDLPKGQTRVFCLDRQSEWNGFADP